MNLSEIKFSEIISSINSMAGVINMGVLIVLIVLVILLYTMPLTIKCSSDSKKLIKP